MRRVCGSAAPHGRRRGQTRQFIPAGASPACTIFRRRRGGGSDRGDVPGWVLVTLMTAGLVVALWAVAGPALTDVFSNAVSSVTGP